MESWMEEFADVVTCTWWPVGVKRVYAFYPVWELSLTIATPAEDALADVCPKHYAVRLRELLTLVETTALSTNQDLREKLMKDEVQPRSSWELRLPCLLTQFWLRFECGTSLGQIEWLRQFASVFFQPLNELPTSSDFNALLEEMDDQGAMAEYDEVRSFLQEENFKERPEWTRHLCFGINSMSSESETAIAEIALMEAVSALFRKQLSNVFKLEDCVDADYEVFLFTRGVPTSPELFEVLPRIRDNTQARHVTLTQAGTSTDGDNYSQRRGVTAAHMLRNKSDKRSPFALFVSGGSEYQHENALQLCQAIANARLTTPVYIEGLWVSPDSVVDLLSTVRSTTSSMQLSIGRLRVNGQHQLTLCFRFKSINAEGSPIKSLGLRYTCESGTVDEAFGKVAKAIGADLIELEVNSLMLSDPSYALIRDLCPRLEVLTINEVSAPIGVLVNHSKKWTIKELNLVLSLDQDLRPLVKALTNPNNAVTTTLTKLDLIGWPATAQRPVRVDFDAVLFEELLQSLRSVRSSLTLRYQVRLANYRVVLNLVNSMMNAGAFDVVVPLALGSKVAFLGVMISKGYTQERGVIETIFKFAASEASHTVLLKWLKRPIQL
ncbi:hypothetical protein Poli38472_011190 [Pythium oligandrum]|uniref:Uncharacterized protein n=1 Tax=Pythium oligandrum TaxID=41045 RepID=A0A8K1CQB3_PYTOL|nr:hypothetical protein Poli38472_011190 [Pythium oligandrum]|eukprot:TMW67570.1 hypothetical protein Poli38472_011190 [Pythium oligandrum]